MIHLAEIYAMESLKSYYKDRNLADRKLDGKHTGKFLNESIMSRRKQKLEYKLAPEEIAVSKKQAEKESQQLIEEHKQKNSWGAWVPTSIFTSAYWTGNQP